MKTQDKSYDRLMREEMGHTLLPLMAQMAQIDLAVLEPLDTQFAKTIEKRVDLLAGKHNGKTNKKGERQYEFILHGEIETKNLTQLFVIRMLGYLYMIIAKFKAPVFQFVFYIGNEPLRLPKFLQSVGYHFRFEVIDIKKIPHDFFLNMGTPNGVVLSILSDWGATPKQEVVEKILQILTTEYKTKKIQEIALKKAVSNLFIFSNLRNLRDEFTQTYQTMAFTFDFIDIKGTIWEEVFEQQLTPQIEEKLTAKIEQRVAKQFKAQVQEVKAQVQEVKVQMQQAEAQMQQAEAQVQQAEAQVQQAEAQVQQAEAQMQQAEAEKEAEKRQSIIRALKRKKLTIDEIAEDFAVTNEYVLAIQKQIP